MAEPAVGVWRTWPEYAGWQEPPEGWEAFRNAQAAGVERGWALSWNGAVYALWRPSWQYSFSPTLAPLEAAIATGNTKMLENLPSDPPVDRERSVSESEAGQSITPAYRLNEIVTGDARELASSLQAGSVDLVFCDPVYQSLEDYVWLAEQSLRVLRPRGVVLAWASVPKSGRAQLAMEDAGLEYVYTLFYTVVAKTYRMRWYNLFCWTTPCLWFQRPGEASRPNRWMPDTFRETIVLPPEVLDNTVIATANPDDPFAWNKNTGVLKRWMERFSQPDEVVWDPFAGSGSVPVTAKMLGRRFYASELVPERAEESRTRLFSTPEPLPLALSIRPAEQAVMTFEEAA